MIQETTVRHLTSEEISQWLVEGPSAAARSHVQACSECSAALAEAEIPLANFRSAVVEWSNARAFAEKPAFRSAAASQERRWLPAAGLAFAALLIGLAVLAGLNQKPVVTQQARVPAVSDSVLIEQVDAEVSETVPDAMAPLTDLVAWDGSSTVSTGVAGHKKGPVSTQKLTQID